MKITVTRQDVIDNPYYTWPDKCPCARVLQRELNNPDIDMCNEHVYKLGTHIRVGKLSPPFLYDDYVALRDGTITEFVMEYTPI